MYWIRFYAVVFNYIHVVYTTVFFSCYDRVKKDDTYFIPYIVNGNIKVYILIMKYVYQNKQYATH